MGYENLHNIEGLQFVPVNEFKQPIVKEWQTSTAKHNLKNCWGVGIVCGIPSGNVECLDIDLKYDLTGKLFDNYKRLVHELEPELLKKIVVQRTKSGGYHFIYRCSEIAGNIKLANRLTTEEERQHTYEKTYKAELQKHGEDEKAKKIAQKAKENDKVRVLFETRGIGGQFVCSPTPGYEFIFGDLCSISEITKQEREVLHGIARQFNDFFEEEIIPKAKLPKTKGKSPFEAYNETDDVIDLLQTHGWQVVKRKGGKTIFLRPGQTSSLSSGNFDHNKRWFSVFTTSTEFDPQKAYLPYAVFAVLECNKDYAEASRRLLDLGYGDKPEEKKPAESTRIIKSRVNSEDENDSFFATPADYDEYLQAVIDGTLVQGRSTGIPTLDKYFLFKEGNLVMTNGHDNAGKSVVVWWLALISAIYYDWCWVILSSENTLGAFMRKMIQFYWGKQLHGRYAMTKQEYETAKKFIEDHFLLVKSEEEMYNYKDVINIFKKALKKKKYHCGMIDPYNGLKTDLSGFSKLSTHEYHYEALSELKLFGKKEGMGLWINHHAVTAALRLKDGEKKYPVAPQKADTEGGGKVANKADDFLTIHRVAQHPTEWMITEIHVRKIKDTETGGRVTPIDEPVKLEMYNNGCSFKERREDGERSIDPIHEWHIRNGPKQPELYTNGLPPKNQPTVVRSVWSPFKDDNGEEIIF